MNIVLTHEQLEMWAGHGLTDDQVKQLDMAISNSSIPQAIAEIVFNLLPDEPEEDNERDIKATLEYLVGELRAGRISYGELAELQSLCANSSTDETIWS